MDDPISQSFVPSAMGVTIASYGIRQRLSRDSSAVSLNPAFRSPNDLLDYTRNLGGGGVQIGIREWPTGIDESLRKRAESYAMYLEGQIDLPKKAGDIDRFQSDLHRGTEAGISIFRTVMLSGRRYETFPGEEAFKQFRTESWESLTRAEPIVRKLGARLAVENHKDWLVPELIGILKRLGSEDVGVTLDVGNNIALLEEPMSVVEALAPYALTTHFKDMAFVRTDEGLRLSEVPLGDGCLDLQRIIRVCRASKPAIRFNLEMITRDPLRVPYCQQSYWSTMPETSAKQLASMENFLGKQSAKRALQVVSNLSPAEQVATEEDNNRKSFAFARERLKL